MNKEIPYVLGTRLRVNHDNIAEIEIVWTATGLLVIKFQSAVLVSWVKARAKRKGKSR